MTTTKVYNGQLITSTATEQDLQPTGEIGDGESPIVQCEIVTGTIKFGVGPAGQSPVIDGNLGIWGSYTSAGTKAYRTVQPGVNNLRAVGAGTFIVSW